MSYGQNSDGAIVAAIRRNGYKATPQRIAICRIALRSHDHPGAQQVYDAVHKEHPTVSLATVYKSLQMLRELNLISEICLTAGQSRYDPLMLSHINLICTQCGKIQDLEEANAQAMMREIAKTARFTMAGQPVSVYGICNECSKKRD